MGGQGSINDIRMALVLTTNTLVDNFHFALGEIGSKKFYASLAVDAWLNEDFTFVRKFLFRSIMLEHLQNHGATRIIQEINREDEDTPGRSLLNGIQGVLHCHDAGLKSILKHCVDTSCICIDMAQTINEEKEVLSNPNVSRDTILARRKERDLPPILKAKSKYWGVKNRAANALRGKKLDEATKLYLHAKGMLEDKRDMTAPMHQIEWAFKIGNEIGKISSNLSMICLRQDRKEEALQYADDACLACPGWHKSFCRRALALMAQGKYEEAQVAIYKAMSKDTTVKERKDCLKIQAEIEAELNNNSSASESSHTNPLYKFKLCDSDRTKQVGTISAISDQDGIMESVYSYLSPSDVVYLELTCKRYANVERTRRIAIGSGLSSLCSDTLSSNDTIENALTNYINNTSDSSTRALQKFVSEVIKDDLTIQKFPSLMNRMGKMDPTSFGSILSVFSDPSETETFMLFDLIDTEFGSRRDFQIARFLLGGDNNVYGAKHHLLDTILNRLDHEGSEDGFTARFFKHSLDLVVMELALSIEIDDDDNDDNMRSLKDTAFTVINNSILVKSVAKRHEMNQEDPLFVHGMAFHSLYTECFPDSYPGEVNWVSGQFDKDTIQQYWVNEQTMFRMWKVALFKALKWVQELEKAGLVSDYLLLSRIIQGEDVLKHPNSPINNFSFGPFLIMKSVEFGGALAMSVRLKNEENMTDLFYDYYSFLKLYRAGFPAAVDHSNRISAAHHNLHG